jgi:recombination protein RecT
MAEITPKQTVVKRTFDLIHKFSGEFMKNIPAHVSKDRMIRVLMNSVRRKPELAECTQSSLVNSMLQACALGLEPDTALQLGNLVKYKTECTFQIGYRGLIDLLRRSGMAKVIYAHPVYEKDEFDYSYVPHSMAHKPFKGEPEEAGKITHVYAVVHFTGGSEWDFEVMTAGQVEKIRKMSRGRDAMAWVEHWPEMARKTVLKRLLKRMPLNADLARAVTYDNAVESGELEDADFEIEAPAETKAEDGKLEKAVAAEKAKQEDEERKNLLERVRTLMGKATDAQIQEALKHAGITDDMLEKKSFTLGQLAALASNLTLLVEGGK